MCTAECSEASFTSTYEMPVAQAFPSHPAVTVKNVSRHRHGQCDNSGVHRVL